MFSVVRFTLLSAAAHGSDERVDSLVLAHERCARARRGIVLLRTRRRAQEDDGAGQRSERRPPPRIRRRPGDGSRGRRRPTELCDGERRKRRPRRHRRPRAPRSARAGRRATRGRRRVLDEQHANRGRASLRDDEERVVRLPSVVYLDVDPGCSRSIAPTSPRGGVLLAGEDREPLLSPSSTRSTTSSATRRCRRRRRRPCRRRARERRPC